MSEDGTVDLNKSISWNKYGQNFPPIDLWVLVFRVKNKKYMIAKCSRLKDECNNLLEQWVTQHGNVHDPDLKDAWISFEPFSDFITYK